MHRKFFAGAATGIELGGIGDEAGPGLADQIQAITRLGWSSIELRNVDGIPLAALDDAAFDSVCSKLADADLKVSCVDSQIAGWARPITSPFSADLRELEALTRRCPALGTRSIRIMSYPNADLPPAEWERKVRSRICRLAAHAESCGLTLLLENCVGWASREGERMLELLELVGSPSLQLLFDTGNGLAYGYDGFELLSEIVDHVAHVHVKDGVSGPTGATFTGPGAGTARLAEILRLLRSRAPGAIWSIEPHTLIRPHIGDLDIPTDVDAIAMFVDYGQELERLIVNEVLAVGGQP